MTYTTNINRKKIIKSQLATAQQSGFADDGYQQAIKQDAQQAFRFILVVDGVSEALIVRVDRPSYEIETKTFKLLNWQTKFPKGFIKWNNISFQVREVFSNDLSNSVAGILINKIKKLGYDTPYSIDSFNLKDLSKSDLINSLGSVKIQMIDPDGKVYEEWSLINAFISKLVFDQLNYSRDSLIGATVTLSYDWATLKYFDQQNNEKEY